MSRTSRLVAHMPNSSPSSSRVVIFVLIGAAVGFYAQHVIEQSYKERQLEEFERYLKNKKAKD